MKIRTRANDRTSKTTTGVLLGIATAIILSLLLSMGLTSLIQKESISENAPGVYVFMIRCLSALAGGLLAATIIGEKHLRTIGIVDGIYFLALLGIGIVVFDGSFHNFVCGALSVLIGGGIAYILKMIPGKKRHTLPKFRK